MRVAFAGLIFVALCGFPAWGQMDPATIQTNSQDKNFSFSDNVDLMEHTTAPAGDPAVVPQHTAPVPSAGAALTQASPQCATGSLESKDPACSPPETESVAPRSTPNALILSVIVVVAGIIGLGLMRTRSQRA